MSTAPSANLQSREAIELWTREWVANEVEVPIQEIDVAKSFLNYGMNSVQAMMLVGDLEDLLSRRLSPTLVWDYPTIGELVGFLAEDASPPSSGDSLSESSVEESAGLVSQAPEELLNRINDLSEQEMDLLLRDYLRKPR